MISKTIFITMKCSELELLNNTKINKYIKYTFEISGSSDM